MRELSLHVLDIVQNSVEAGATKIKLSINEDVDTFLTIIVSDNGRGMDEETCGKVTDAFVTTRKTRRVGLGLALLEMTTSRCGGGLTVQSEAGVGTTVTASFQYSHWDRPPLGDMINTLKTIIIANSAIELIYHHSFAGRSFEFDTANIKACLNGIPLTHPHVLEWLNSFLQQSFSNLYGGA